MTLIAEACVFGCGCLVGYLIHAILQTTMATNELTKIILEGLQKPTWTHTTETRKPQSPKHG